MAAAPLTNRDEEKQATSRTKADDPESFGKDDGNPSQPLPLNDIRTSKLVSSGTDSKAPLTFNRDNDAPA